MRLSIAMLACASSLASAAPVGVRAHASKREGHIAIDGVLDEAVWKTTPHQGHFIQRFPKDGGVPDFPTEFAVVYDADAIYVGVWATDPEPQKIRAQLTRRDVDALADAIVVSFDSYHDRRTAYSFQLNAAGVQRDVLMYDDQNQDDTWDAVWTGNAAVDAHGWTAEFRIPLNQLRYADENKEWGVQVMRVVGRTTEQSTWSPWPRSAPQVVSRFGTLEGLDKIPQAHRLELLPYVSGGFEVQPSDPINDRWVARHGIGLDLKYGLGPAFTLSATINPDFGQVEADPSQVNLGPSELFYAEKRPFFLEGVDLFKLPIGNNDSGVEGQFYSRRIGATPQLPAMDYQYIRQPQAQTIYGAMKLTGKTQGGWSLGLFDAVTGQETADVIEASGNRVEPVVAALTNYAVGRVKRDLRDGKTSIGIAATAVDRSLEGTPLADVLHDQAYTGGIQLDHRWDDNAWEARLSMVGSWIHGSEAAIATTQQLTTHLFQRPDIEDEHFDPTRTSMAGLGASWKIGRYGDTKHWRYGIGGDLRTPGLELNNIGFQQGSDQLVPYIFGQYREDEPHGEILNYNLSADIFTISNFDPILENYGWESSGGIQFTNYWSVSGGLSINGGGLDAVALRGGPALRFDHGVNPYLSITSDNRKRFQVSVAGSANHDWIAGMMAGSLDATATIQARSNLDLTLAADWSRRDDPMQYVAEATDTANAMHYITGHIKFTSASLTARVNWTFSPHLSLQAYAQPFIATGEYAELKDVDHPHADRFADRFHLLAQSEVHAANGTMFASYHGSYSFTKPDFSFQQLRSTIVLRWEYRPGSNVFAIWSHGQTNELTDGRFALGSNLSDLLRAASDNTVMVKLSYWIGL